MSKEQFQPLRENNPMLAELEKFYKPGSVLNEVASPLGDSHKLYEHTNVAKNVDIKSDHFPKNR